MISNSFLLLFYISKGRIMINLIKNTLLSVLLLQLLALAYIKLIYQKTKPTLPQPSHIKTLTLNVMKNRTKKTDTTTNTPTKKIIELSPKNFTTIHVQKEEKVVKNSKSNEKLLKSPVNINTKVEEYAKKFLGNKYVWGATGPNTFDCSGFTQKVYRDSTGINIPRVSREQAKVGIYINYSELKQGDMVFFDTSKEHKGMVNHVGIYLENGDFIHASSGGKKVMITNFNKKRFYKNRFLWGRRIIQEHTNIATLIDKKREES
jgi:cell wall-associated NlpC family hydrolase